jgi:hypothetical protein
VDPKDPQDEVDYSINWTKQLTELGVLIDTIVASDWDVPDGIDMEDETFTDTRTVIWLSGGTAGSRYQLTNQITTANNPPRKLSQTITIRVKEL